ncbi:receptor kinase-like protein Xa21 [Gossypium hirsutum]|uniref:Receptor kinase-like protein Xa21 n=1 Tax=Gossypium hirsutum TaxID=3635 RepID=A0ABM2YNE2_GOSHI|nr:receptor kinase-like protein Xa21 [Gossypium hirsutum]
MSNLENLDLRNNLVHGNIPYEMSKLMKLRTLRLAKNQLSGSIPAAIYNISALRMISLPYNNLSGEIPWEIGKLEKLEYLHVEYMRLDGSIPASIFNLSSLKTIVLGDNNLSGELPYITSVPNLEKIFLWGNHLSGNILDSISNITKLKILELQRNSFSGLIPNALGNLQFLERLTLRSNHLTTKTSSNGWSFLDSLTKCRYLIHLDLSLNPLGGVLPPSISNLSISLLQFEATACKIKGNIPMEIDSLNNALTLVLSVNELSGSIPTTIGRLKNIQLLEFSGNKLQGSIPHQLCGLKGLYKLSFATNELDGPLPVGLGNLIALKKLNFSSNKLHSSIPLSFWRLKDILEVDLSSNYFSGSLSLDIGNLEVTTHLDLSRNFLSSDIPSTFGSLHYLQVLLLSHNRLQGPIPESLGDMISLVKLEGEIPKGGCFVNFTAKSFMKNYALCGSPRLQVQPCKKNGHRHPNKTLLHVTKYVLPIFGSIIIVLAFIIVYKKRKNKSTGLTIVEDLVHVRQWRRISYYQLWEGTDGFNERNLLGSGSFGSIYKGMLSCGTEVAIKVFNLEIEGAFKSFDVECEVMAEILHRNLVKIITCCSTIDFKALVLEFMPNGSLEKWLHSDDHALDILQRINIMVDVALALEYLHSGFLIPIIHCDLKPSNVLLDEDMVGHVGDFGVSKLLGEGDSIKQTMTLATVGYMAPEYGSAGIVSVKCDVYSYGILLMETFTRKKPTNEYFVGEMSMKHWVKMSLSNGINGVGDSSIVQEEDEYFVVKANCISSIMELALNCSAELPENRMDMKNESEEQALQALSIHKDSGHGKNKWRGRSSDERRNFWDHRIPHGKPKAIDKSQIECF